MESILINDCPVLIEKQERYLQLDDTAENKLNNLWPVLQKEYPRYKVMFCYHNTVAPRLFLREIGAELLDDCAETRLRREDYMPAAIEYSLPHDAGIMRVTEENFETFARFHDRQNPGMYWTSERLRKNIRYWHIVMAVKDGQITGYILTSVLVKSPVAWASSSETRPLGSERPAPDAWASSSEASGQAEIFCINAPDDAGHKILLSAAAAFAFKQNKAEVLFMADENSREKEAALAVGFRVTGRYQGYAVEIF